MKKFNIIIYAILIVGMMFIRLSLYSSYQDKKTEECIFNQFNMNDINRITQWCNNLGGNITESTAQGGGIWKYECEVSRGSYINGNMICTSKYRGMFK